jgi:hypothetical protein
MRKIGGYMIFFGLFAIVLNFFDRVPSILMWIYNWGEGVAWAIKIGLIVVGAILFFMGKPEVEAEEAVEPIEESAE